jgi:hypothetical protein
MAGLNLSSALRVQVSSDPGFAFFQRDEGPTELGYYGDL